MRTNHIRNDGIYLVDYLIVSSLLHFRILAYTQWKIKRKYRVYNKLPTLRQKGRCVVERDECVNKLTSSVRNSSNKSRLTAFCVRNYCKKNRIIIQNYAWERFPSESYHKDDGGDDDNDDDTNHHTSVDRYHRQIDTYLSIHTQINQHRCIVHQMSRHLTSNN